MIISPRPWSCEAGGCDGDAQAGKCKNTPMRYWKQALSGKDHCFYPVKRPRRPAEQILVRRFLRYFWTPKSTIQTIKLVFIVKQGNNNNVQTNSGIDNHSKLKTKNSKFTSRDCFSRLDVLKSTSVIKIYILLLLYLRTGHLNRSGTGIVIERIG